MNRDRPNPSREIRIDAGGHELIGDLVVPPGASAIVLFAHGSGSSRHSSRNRAVARSLEDAGFATLLLDLLTAAEEERERAGGMLRFDVSRLATRLSYAIHWLEHEKETRDLALGLFGASTGAAAALIAAAERPARVQAVVSRGGRPDMAGRELAFVRCPTLLIVGGDDREVLDLNRRAFHPLTCVKELVVIPGATHLFEERGALQEVARLASEWFLRHLRAPAAPRTSVPQPADRPRESPDPRVRTPEREGPRGASASTFVMERPRPETPPPAHEPVAPRPQETPVRTEPPYVPAPPPPSPPAPRPEFQPFHPSGRRS